jgi:hypothetical protein
MERRYKIKRKAKYKKRLKEKRMAGVRLQIKMELGHGEEAEETKGEGNLSAIRHKGNATL